jgi:hypothetical protein
MWTHSAELHSHTQIECFHCGKRNLLHHEMLLQWRVDPTAPASSGDGIAVLCFACKHVYMYTEPEETFLPGETGFFPPAAWRCFVISLSCEEPLCGVPLPVFAGRNIDTTCTELRNEAEDWVFAELFCPKGHPVYQKNIVHILD